MEKKRNIYWDTICHFWQWNPVIKQELTRCGRLARDFKLKEPDPIKFPEVLHSKFKIWQRTYPGAACTPEAMLKHWDFLKTEAEKGSRYFVPDKVDDEELPKNDDWDEIEQMLRQKGLK